MKKLPFAEIVVVAVVVAAGLGVYLYAHRDAGAIEATRQRGDVIVEALERHRAATGAYPDSLQQLVPAQLDSVPHPVWGTTWTYRSFQDGAHAELAVSEPDGRLTLRYDFTGRGWALDN